MRCRRQERGSRFGAELGEGLHRQAAIALGEHAERRLAILVRQLAEDLREIRGVLFLKQIQQVCGRTDAQEPLHRVEDEIDTSLRGHRQLQERAAQNRRGDGEVDDKPRHIDERGHEWRR